MYVTINKQVYQVKFVDGEDENMHPEKDLYNLGLTDYVESIIYIRKGMRQIMTRETVIHELVHAFKFSYGYSVDSEEAMCNFFGAQGDEIMKAADEIMKGVTEGVCD